MATTIKTDIVKISDLDSTDGIIESNAEDEIKNKIKNKYEDGYELLSTSGFAQTRSGQILLLLIYKKTT